MIHQNKWIRCVLSCLLAICLLLSVTIPSYAGAKQTEATIIVHQSFVVKGGKSPSVGTAVDYKLTPLKPGIPMPDGTNEAGEYYFTLDGTVQTSIKINYTHAGFYQYQIQPVIEKEYEGYTYDKTVYTANVYVENVKDGLAAAVIGVNHSDEKVEEFIYQFSYEVKDDSDSTQAKTGDTTNVMPYMMAGVTSLLLIFLVISGRIKNRDEDEEVVE